MAMNRWDLCCHDVGVEEDGGRCCPTECVRSPLLGVAPGMRHRYAYSCIQAHRHTFLCSKSCISDESHLLGPAGDDDRTSGCAARSGLVGCGSGSGLAHILAPDDLILRKGDNACRFLSLRLVSLPHEWNHLVWPKAGLVWQQRVDEIAGHRHTSRLPHVFWLLE